MMTSLSVGVNDDVYNNNDVVVNDDDYNDDYDVVVVDSVVGADDIMMDS